jgi:hypothetical protein
MSRGRTSNADASLRPRAVSGIITPGAAIALRTLESDDVNSRAALAQAATGKAVATAADNPAAYVVALGLNSDMLATMAVSRGVSEFLCVRLFRSHPSLGERL